VEVIGATGDASNFATQLPVAIVTKSVGMSAFRLLGWLYERARPGKIAIKLARL